MKNKYLDDIGVKTYKNYPNCCGKAEDRKKYKKQRKKYGFDGRECYALNYSAAAWLYGHLKRYYKDAKGFIDLTYYEFDIPVLYPSDKKDYREEKPWNDTVIENHTQEEGILLCIEYLKEYLTSDNYDENLPIEEINRIEGIAEEKGQCAFHIFSILLPTMWW